MCVCEFVVPRVVTIEQCVHHVRMRVCVWPPRCDTGANNTATGSTRSSTSSTCSSSTCRTRSTRSTRSSSSKATQIGTVLHRASGAAPSLTAP